MPEVHGPLHQEGLVAVRYRGKASAELAPLTRYADLEVYSTPAPTVHIAQQQPARQTVAASSCYVAVGRCGYVPPEELRLRLTHHERDSDKYHAVRSMLNDLLKLANHYLTWRRRTWPVSMTRREELEHRAATHCRECLASFETEKKLHHCHGTGQYLGALCHSCNIAAQTPKTIPVVLSAQGTARRAWRERRKRGREAHAHGQGRAKGRTQVQGQGRAKAPHRLARPAGLRVLCKSGEKCLQGPAERLRRPQGLHTQAAAGASPRAAAAHADGLSAPKTASQTAADALRPGAGVGLHPEMPAVWEQHCYDSVLAGKAVSAEDHRLAVSTAYLMGWETFHEFHDGYLHTDVLALADVMESYRDSFRPIHHVTLPGAAWDATLRHSARKTPIHLITDEQAYKDVRSSVMGALSCIFQPSLKPTTPSWARRTTTARSPSAGSCTRPQ